MRESEWLLLPLADLSNFCAHLESADPQISVYSPRANKFVSYIVMTECISFYSSKDMSVGNIHSLAACKTL
jgi:hypothetical protein